MTVCYFGIYNPGYSRNRINIKGLKENGIEIIECSDRGRDLLKYWRLFLRHWQIRKSYDAMIVGFPGQAVMLLAKLISDKPIIFDAFVSLYDSEVMDRGNCAKNSLKAKYFHFLDYFSCHLADKILLDTNEHIKYFIKEFGIDEKKFIKILIGEEGDKYLPESARKNTNKFLVHFHGNGIPLHGLPYILAAARILQNQNIEFNIIGALKEEAKINLPNINYFDFMALNELYKHIKQADVCLGIFGNTDKAARVIPNKVYEAMACAKPVITADTLAIRELLQDEENCLLVKRADAQDLADKILMLKNNKELMEKIARGGYELAKTITPKTVIQPLVVCLNNL